MKTNALIATVLGVLALTFCSLSVYADEAQGDTGAEQVLCASLHGYAIHPEVYDGSSTYAWGVDGGTSGTDWVLTNYVDPTRVDPDYITVDWKNAGTYKLWSQETSEKGCEGPKTILNVKVSPLPEVDPISNNICSTTQGKAPAVDVVNLELPQAKNAGATVSKWVIKEINIPTGVTAATTNAAIGETTDKDYIKNDAYTNANAVPENVVYTVTPYAGDCAGEDFTVTVTVYPEVKAPKIRF